MGIFNNSMYLCYYNIQKDTMNSMNFQINSTLNYILYNIFLLNYTLHMVIDIFNIFLSANYHILLHYIVVHIPLLFFQQFFTKNHIYNSYIQHYQHINNKGRHIFHISYDNYPHNICQGIDSRIFYSCCCNKS